MMHKHRPCLVVCWQFLCWELSASNEEERQKNKMKETGGNSACFFLKTRRLGCKEKILDTGSEIVYDSKGDENE